MAQWIRHLTTNQGIAGSSPAKVKLFKKFPLFSYATWVWGEKNTHIFSYLDGFEPNPPEVNSFWCDLAICTCLHIYPFTHHFYVLETRPKGCGFNIFSIYLLFQSWLKFILPKIVKIFSHLDGFEPKPPEVNLFWCDPAICTCLHIYPFKHHFYVLETRPKGCGFNSHCY